MLLPESSACENINSRAVKKLTLQERYIIFQRDVRGVSPATVVWYRYAFRHFAGCGLEELSSQPAEIRHAVQDRIIELRQGSTKPISIDSWLRAVRGYCHWALREGYITKPITIDRPKVADTRIQAWSPQHVKALLELRPKAYSLRRAQVIATLALDTGLRIHEMLGLERCDVDLESGTITVIGKGGRLRTVPMSPRCQVVMRRWLTTHQGSFVFAAAGGCKPLRQRNALRDLVRLCKRAGITGVRTSWHTLRHTMAMHYIAAGGDVMSLQQTLGHADIAMTQRYVTLSEPIRRRLHNRYSRLV